MAVIDVIKFDGFTDGRAWVAYKYPGDQFMLGSQLIVNPSQEAVFIKGGEICDVFGTGTHTLQTGNLPILNKLVKLPFGGRTPFTAEAFFVNKSSRLDMTWGTATPFQLEDPKYGIIVSIRAHGKYGIKITNSSLFVGELVGSAPSNAVFSHSFINSYFNSMLISYIKSTISSYMMKGKISFLDVTAYLPDLSKECNESVSKEFERYGIEITNLCIETVSPPSSDYESLKRMKEKHALGEHIYAQEDSAVLISGGPGVELSAKGESGEEFSDDENTAAAKNTPSASHMAVCPICSNNVPIGQKFCGECGAKMEKKCSSCGNVWDASHKFCGECGTKLE